MADFRRINGSVLLVSGFLFLGSRRSKRKSPRSLERENNKFAAIIRGSMGVCGRAIIMTRDVRKNRKQIVIGKEQHFDNDFLPQAVILVI